MRWMDLSPDEGILAALDHAGSRPEMGTQDQKRGWSERFANGCAIAVAAVLRKSAVGDRLIRPKSLSEGTEPLTPLGAGTSKRIDVTVVDSVLGLEIGVSLKGLNFRDGSSGNFDKNLTGRLYELGDEVRLVHEHLPRAFMVGMFFLPVEAATDKVSGNSSFANAVVKLRARTGRLDPSIGAQALRCDASYVGLYSVDAADTSISRGVVRFLDVNNNPPRRGRPQVEHTFSLEEVVADFVAKATFSSNISWAEPEGHKHAFVSQLSCRRP
jgi:hypothetical protein